MKVTQYLSILFGLVFAFPAFAAYDVPFAPSDYRNVLEQNTSDCIFAGGDISRCPLSWNGSSGQNVNYVTSLSFPDKFSTTTITQDFGGGFGFRAVGDMQIYGISLNVLSPQSNARLDVDIVLGDDPNATADTRITLDVPRVYTTDQKVIFDKLLDDTQSLASHTYLQPITVHDGQMVWFRYYDGKLSSDTENYTFYGLSYVPWTSDPYNGYMCVNNSENSPWDATTTPPSYMPTTIGLRHWAGNPNYVMGQFVPRPIPQSCTWRDNTFMQNLALSFQMTVYPNEIIIDPNGNSRPVFAEPTLSLETCESFADVGCHIANLGNRIVYAFKYSLWYTFDKGYQLLLFLFSPSDSTLAKFKNLKLEERVPFVYFTATKAMYETAGTYTPENVSLNLNLGDITNNQSVSVLSFDTIDNMIGSGTLSAIRAILGTMIVLVGLFGIYKIVMTL